MKRLAHDPAVVVTGPMVAITAAVVDQCGNGTGGGSESGTRSHNQE